MSVYGSVSSLRVSGLKYFRYALKETKDSETYLGARGTAGQTGTRPIVSCHASQIVHKLSENGGKFHESGDPGHIIHFTTDCDWQQQHFDVYELIIM